MKLISAKLLKKKFIQISLPVIAVLFVVFITLIFTKKTQEFPPAPQLNMFISYGEGEMLVSQNNGEWEPASNKTALVNGNRIRTGKNSKIVLQSPSGNTVRMDENTELEIGQLNNNDFLIIQNMGRTYNRVINKENQSYKLRAFNHTVSAIGANFDVSTNKKANRVNVKVLDGKIDMAIKLDELIEVQKISSGKEVTIDPADVNLIALSDVTDEYLNSDWHKWNVLEDGKYIAGSTSPIETNDADGSINANPVSTKPGEASPPKPSQPKTGSCKPYLTAKKDDTYKGILVYWTTCTSDDFQFYKIVRSTLDANPSYPKDPVVSSSSNRSYANFIDKTVAPNRTYYYRVCVIERLDRVSCSNVVSVVY